MSRNMFVQNFVELSATVHELLCALKKTQTKTLQSVASAQTVKINDTTTSSLHYYYQKNILQLSN